MTQTDEVKKPKNPDYTASAVKLTNAPEVKALLDEWQAAKQLADEAQEQMQAELLKLPSVINFNTANDTVAEARATLEKTIIEFGGFQDIEQGLYALQQVRKLTTYDADKIRKNISKYADVILSGVDTVKLKGLVKGGLVTPEQVAKCSEVKESHRFVIDAVKGGATDGK